MSELSLLLSLEVMDLWHHRLCLGHTLQVIASPDGGVYEELRSENTSFLLAGPRCGPPDALRGRMLYRIVQKTRQHTHLSGIQGEAAGLLHPTRLVA